MPTKVPADPLYVSPVSYPAEYRPAGLLPDVKQVFEKEVTRMAEYVLEMKHITKRYGENTVLLSLIHI